jgi:hypothetical protein
MRTLCEDTGYLRRDCWCETCDDIREELENLRSLMDSLVDLHDRSKAGERVDRLERMLT